MLLRAAVLLLVTIAGLLPTLLTRGWEGTEGRRAQIALEMLRSGDWMIPTLGGEPTWAKPPLHYWTLAGCAHWFGDELVAMRLPAILFVFLAAWCAMELLRPWFGIRAGWVAALGMLTSPIVLREWPSAEIDPTFASFTAMSLWTLATGVARERRGLVVTSGVLAGLALLQKGPPFFLFAAGAYLVWWRRRGLRHALAHFVPMLLVAAAYFVPLWTLRVAPDQMMADVTEETVGRVKYFEWEHIRAIPEYWLRAIAIQLPMGLWCFWEWRGARDARMDAGDVTLRMCSGAAVVAVALLTFFPGRPTRYLLPNVLLFGFAVAPAVAHYSRQLGPIGPIVRRVVHGTGAVGALVMLVLPFTAQASALPIAFVLAIAPWLVRRPVHFVAWCFALPLVATFVVGFAGESSWQGESRLREAVGRVLRQRLDALGATEGLATWGHVDSVVLLEAGVLPPGDEPGRRPPSAPWLLCEEKKEDAPRSFAGYTARARVCGSSKVFAVFERTGTPR